MTKKSYCTFCREQAVGNLHRIYHDTEYGKWIENDDELFGRLVLEINQAGLSWSTILAKKQQFDQAYDGFSVIKIANYTETDIERLLSNPGIIRNRLKIKATIFNANRLLSIQSTHGSFATWLLENKSRDLTSWLSLFKKNFKFVGTEIVKEFLQSIGLIDGAHDKDCPFNT
jgi:DNA-3-methyladenine glycosylase I